MIPDAIHPSVIFHDNKYWMAYTPYPDWDTKQENPSILVSDNGKDWTEPCKNPIAPAPPDGGHNCDPFLFFENGLFHCVFCHYFVDFGGTEHTLIKQLTSSDGKQWGDGKILKETPGVLISPCIVDDKLWYIKVGVKQKGEMVTPYGLFRENKRIDFDIPHYYIWHFEIRKSLTKYWMLMSAYRKEKSALECRLFYAESTDGGDTWEMNNYLNPIRLIKSYKSSAVGNRLWISVLINNQWCIDDTNLD